MKHKSLLARGSHLSAPDAQWDLLEQGPFTDGRLPKFTEKLKQHRCNSLRPKKLEILQINMGYMCNQVCAHCHVDAGPDRKEIMSREIMEDCLAVMREQKIVTVDLTGGAPEMHPEFKWFVSQIRQTTSVEEIIVRSNLTIILANQKFHDLPRFFSEHKVHVISSLPFYKKNKTDRQRGNGVFQQSIDALKLLNKEGYGLPQSELLLDLVYNPSGAFLPGDQLALEKDFKSALKTDFGIEFHHLYTITNLPISRFLEYLVASDNFEEYMYTLVEAFNPVAANNVMCTNTLSVSWDGYLYDCDFNQMLKLNIKSTIQHIRDFSLKTVQERSIALGQHCYGCTAGAGSSCQGSIA